MATYIARDVTGNNSILQDILAIWLRILARVPRSILWLLRFPAAGEEHIMRTAKLWASDEVASRIRFTDVAKKDEHVYRARVADLFLDTLEVRPSTRYRDLFTHKDTSV